MWGQSLSVRSESNILEPDPAETIASLQHDIGKLFWHVSSKPAPSGKRADIKCVVNLFNVSF